MDLKNLNKFRFLFFSALIIFIGILSVSAVSPFSITVNTGGIDKWYIPGVNSPWQTAGTQSLSILPGSYTFYGAYGSSSFSFTVDGGGNVACSNTYVTCSGSSVTINAPTITFNTGNVGNWYVYGVNNPWQPSGSQNLKMLPGSYTFYGAYGYGTFTFTIDSSGNVQYNAALEPFLSGAGTKTLTIDGYKLKVDGGCLDTYYGIFTNAGAAIEYPVSQGQISQEFYLIPGSYRVIYAGQFGDAFTVNSDGTVSPTSQVFHGCTVKLYGTDNTPPVTTKTPNFVDGDSVEDSFTLTCNDAESGCDKIMYSINGNPSVSFNCGGANTCSTTVSAPADSFSVQFYSSDVNGNNESVQTQTEFGDACPTLAGQSEFQGCPVGDKNTVTLHTVNIGGGSSSKAPLAGVQVRVFDRNDAAFQTVAGSKNPDGSLYGVIFEADAGRVGACTTDNTGVCIAGEAQVGDYLVIVKYVDSSTGKTVYVGRPKSPSDFVNGLAEKDFQIIKVFKKGVFQEEYRGGSKIVVITGSLLEIIAPESAVWEGTQSTYPFIFTSDSSWSVDLCAAVPSGYNVAGVYDEDGNLISTSECTQVFVAGETKVVAFEVVETGSPEPSLSATLKIKGPNGKSVTKNVQASDIRRNTFNEKVNVAKEKAAKHKNKVSAAAVRNLQENAVILETLLVLVIIALIIALVNVRRGFLSRKDHAFKFIR